MYILLIDAAHCIFAENKNTDLSIKAPPLSGKLIEISALLVIEYVNTVMISGLPVHMIEWRETALDPANSKYISHYLIVDS